METNYEQVIMKKENSEIAWFDVIYSGQCMDFWEISYLKGENKIVEFHPIHDIINIKMIKKPGEV